MWGPRRRFSERFLHFPFLPEFSPSTNNDSLPSANCPYCSFGGRAGGKCAHCRRHYLPKAEPEDILIAQPRCTVHAALFPYSVARVSLQIVTKLTMEHRVEDFPHEGESRVFDSPPALVLLMMLGA